MKKITVKSSYYSIDATVVTMDGNGIVEVVAAHDVSLVRSERANKKQLIGNYEREGLKVLSVVNLTATRKTMASVYEVRATNDAIVDACIAAGLDVFNVTDGIDIQMQPIDTDESEEA